MQYLTAQQGRLFYFRKREIFLLLISKAEAEEIRNNFSHIKISATMKNHSKSKRGKRYVPAYKNIIAFLSEKRGVKTIDE